MDKITIGQKYDKINEILRKCDDIGLEYENGYKKIFNKRCFCMKRRYEIELEVLKEDVKKI